MFVHEDGPGAQRVHDKRNGNRGFIMHHSRESHARSPFALKEGRSALGLEPCAVMPACDCASIAVCTSLNVRRCGHVIWFLSCMCSCCCPARRHRSRLARVPCDGCVGPEVSTASQMRRWIASHDRPSEKWVAFVTWHTPLLGLPAREAPLQLPQPYRRQPG